MTKGPYDDEPVTAEDREHWAKRIKRVHDWDDVEPPRTPYTMEPPPNYGVPQNVDKNFLREAGNILMPFPPKPLRYRLLSREHRIRWSDWFATLTRPQQKVFAQEYLNYWRDMALAADIPIWIPRLPNGAYVLVDYAGLCCQIMEEYPGCRRIMEFGLTTDAEPTAKELLSLKDGIDRRALTYSQMRALEVEDPMFSVRYPETYRYMNELHSEDAPQNHTQEELQSWMMKDLETNVTSASHLLVDVPPPISSPGIRALSPSILVPTAAPLTDENLRSAGLAISDRGPPTESNEQELTQQPEERARSPRWEQENRTDPQPGFGLHDLLQESTHLEATGIDHRAETDQDRHHQSPIHGTQVSEIAPLHVAVPELLQEEIARRSETTGGPEQDPHLHA